jgi:hypothetical protein
MSLQLTEVDQRCRTTRWTSAGSASARGKSRACDQCTPATAPAAPDVSVSSSTDGTATCDSFDAKLHTGRTQWITCLGTGCGGAEHPLVHRFGTSYSADGRQGNNSGRLAPSDKPAGGALSACSAITPNMELRTGLCIWSYASGPMHLLFHASSLAEVHCAAVHVQPVPTQSGAVVQL